jgi:SAM-dependent methyltransferase
MGAEALDVPDEAFDVALCQFGLMFVPDPVQALPELRRALRAGGRLGIVVWSTADKVLCFTPQRLLAAVAPPLPPEARLPTPLDLGEPGLIERQVAEAGFRAITAERQTLDYVVDDPEKLWRFIVTGAPPHVAAALQQLTPEQYDKLHEDVLALLETHRQGDKILLPSEAIYVTAIR